VTEQAAPRPRYYREVVAPGRHAADGLMVVSDFDIPLVTGSFRALADWLMARALAPTPTIAMHVNVLNYYLLAKDPWFRQALAPHSTFIFDGIGMKVGARLRGAGWLPDVNGTDLFPMVMERLGRTDASAFFLGGRESVVERAVANVRTRFPNVRIAGWHHGYFGTDEYAAIAERIRGSHAQMLLMSRGPLRRDHFILQQRHAVGAPLIWNVGGLFDFVSGERRRAPVAVRALRLEWAYRLCRDPRSMWYRNAVAAPSFLADAVRWRIRSSR
jgi:N-acetylglucosaminyldiphosphoundecaprenol N-acetyl-beta-D-mannosaminyltransferase